MKSLFKSKRISSGLMVAALGVTVLLSGITLAWFTSSGRGETDDTITIGALDVVADVKDHKVTDAFPGSYHPDQLGYVQNRGTVPALVKLTLEPTIRKYYELDADGKTPIRLDNPVDITGDEALELISIDWQEEGTEDEVLLSDGETMAAVREMGYYYADTPELHFYQWGELTADTSVKFMQMAGNKQFNFAYTVDLSKNPAAMGNDFMGAEIFISVIWDAVQLDPDDALAEIGVAWDDITWFMDNVDQEFDENISVLSEPMNGLTQPQTFEEFLAGRPDSSFKRHVVELLGLDIETEAVEVTE